MLTQKTAKEILYVDHEAGTLNWKTIPKNSTKKTNIAGNILNCGTIKYMTFMHKGRQYLSHRVIWLITYGEWPAFIDHIDGNGLNNRISNLRNVSMAENAKNRPIQRNSKTGISGISYRHDHKKFVVRISSKGKRLSLGSFDDFFEACCARKKAEIILGFHKNHGRKPINL